MPVSGYFLFRSVFLFLAVFRLDGLMCILFASATLMVFERLPNGAGRKNVEFCHSGASRNLVQCIVNGIDYLFSNFISHKGTKNTKEETAAQSFVFFVPLCETYTKHGGA